MIYFHLKCNFKTPFYDKILYLNISSIDFITMVLRLLEY